MPAMGGAPVSDQIALIARKHTLLAFVAYCSQERWEGLVAQR
jgi:hypothetical protein